ncbi:MAG: HPF/RaiA family ribosome-associated protein [Halobacteriovoraceae bacterium]|nr:HPF/RaiA family ribosome-associated protein [Halobacteriovoraceae bacterium]
MDKLLIEWGKLDRTDALESQVTEKAAKILKFHPDATKLIVTFQIINPVSSKGPAVQKVSMELRKPNKQDIRSSKEGTNAYSLISEAEKVLLKKN